jgi:hypothetical protein
MGLMIVSIAARLHYKNDVTWRLFLLCFRVLKFFIILCRGVLWIHYIENLLNGKQYGSYQFMS